MSSPCTGSLNVTVKLTLGELVVVAPTVLMERGLGTILSILKLGPLKGRPAGNTLGCTLPTTALLTTALPARSLIPVALVMLRPRVPLPEPVLTVTVQVVPLPVTLAILAPVMPLAARAKLAAVSPVTGLLKTTLKLMLDLLVVVLPSALMAETLGASLSMV